MRISVVIPTITGREESLAKIVAAYRERTPGRLQIITPKDYPAWPAGCNAGQLEAAGDILHFGADDLEPLPGWFEAMLPILQAGELPGAQVWNWTHEGRPVNEDQDGPAGSITAFTRVPTLTRAMADAIGVWPPELHYYSDNWVSEAARMHGWPTRITEGYAFIHHWHPVGRLDAGDWVGRYLPMYEAEVAKLWAVRP